MKCHRKKNNLLNVLIAKLATINNVDISGTRCDKKCSGIIKCRICDAELEQVIEHLEHNGSRAQDAGIKEIATMLVVKLLKAIDSKRAKCTYEIVFRRHNEEKDEYECVLQLEALKKHNHHKNF